MIIWTNTALKSIENRIRQEEIANGVEIVEPHIRYQAIKENDKYLDHVESNLNIELKQPVMILKDTKEGKSVRLAGLWKKVRYLTPSSDRSTNHTISFH